MRRKKQKSIRNQLLLVLLFFIMVPLLIMGTITNIITKNVIASKVDYLVNQNFENMYLSISNTVEALFNLVNSYAEDEYVAESLKNQYDEKETYYYIDKAWANRDVMSRINYPFYYTVLDYNGNMYTSFTYSPNANYEKIYGSIEDKDWFEYLKNSYTTSSLIFSDVDMLNEDNGEKIYIGQNILYESENVGIVLVQVDKKHISSWLDNLYFNSSVSSYIVSAKGYCLAKGRNNAIEYDEVINIFEPDKKLFSGYETVHIENGPYLYISKKIDFAYNSKIHWYITMLLQTNEIYRDVRIINLVICIMILICFAAFIITANFCNTKIIKPIEYISSAMHRVKNGDLEIKITDLPNNEISNLGNGFNLMINEINELIKNVYKEESEKRDIAIKMLQAQIRPHFIRNTLNIIQWMAKMKKAYGVSKAIQSFTSLIDYNFINTSPLTTIKDELSFLEDYIYFEKIRYQNKFIHKVDVDETLLEKKILKLTLQPIVENSIIHGIAPKKNQGSIKISARREDDEVIFEIADDGMGISESIFVDIWDDKIYDGTKSESHIGIANVNKRIKLNYGESYGIQIKSTQNEGTVVTIKLPLIDDKTELI